jgi:hypothetical protein
MRRSGGNTTAGGVERKWLDSILPLVSSTLAMASSRKEIEHPSMRSRKNFLTFAPQNSLAVTLVSQLAQIDHHFFLDFIFH